MTPQTTRSIRSSLSLLLNWIESRDYRGWDPYDGLLSPLFKLPVLRSNKTIRFFAQQAIRRSPVNLRPALAIPKGRNPVTLGLCIQAYAYLAQTTPEEKEDYLSGIRKLIRQLKDMSPYYSGEMREFTAQNLQFKNLPHYSGACWGYDFPWQARYASIPAFQPTVVATGIITNGLYEAWRLMGIEECREICESAASFVLDDLNRSFDGDSICFSYSPFDQQQVLNASMKGVRILVQAAACCEGSGRVSDPSLQTSNAAVKFVLRHQRSDGSFPYSLAPGGGWVDNYHTGYVLDCLDEYRKLSGDDSISPFIQKGFEYYKTHFLANGGVLDNKKLAAHIVPKFYNDKTYPVDCTAAAQTVLTLSRFGEKEKAAAVADFTIEMMQSKKGYFHYRLQTAHRKLPTDFMRWSDAWMAVALARLLFDEN